MYGCIHEDVLLRLVRQIKSNKLKCGCCVARVVIQTHVHVCEFCGRLADVSI